MSDGMSFGWAHEGRYIEVGKKYKVSWSDCCVTGEFTAKVSEIVWMSEAEYGGDGESYGNGFHTRMDHVLFDNGVTLEEAAGYTVVEVSE